MPTATIGTGKQNSGVKQAGRTMSNMMATESLVKHMSQYAAENPASAAMWCFAIGFVLGWKLKPW